MSPRKKSDFFFCCLIWRFVNTWINYPLNGLSFEENDFRPAWMIAAFRFMGDCNVGGMVAVDLHKHPAAWYKKTVFCYERRQIDAGHPLHVFAVGDAVLVLDDVLILPQTEGGMPVRVTPEQAS